MKCLPALLFVITVFSSCTTIYFEHPQPKGDPALKGFPKSFQGAYFVKDGALTDTLFVEKDKFVYPENFKKSLPLASLDTIPTMRIAGNLLYDDTVPIDYGIPFTESNDSIHYDITIKMDKKLSEVLVLKKFGKLLVLNEKEDKKDYWNTYLIEKLKNGNLQVSAVGNFKPEGVEDKKGNFDGELKDFYSITSFTQLSDDSFLINPDKKAFQQLFNKDFFKKVEVYERVK
ncbi:hypothetical protein [Fulvivirga lutimaris]|uniref:hypothetical protein n=1 Tax=Fulvivirga lutimaris TaxID=1819566 RepID=UPI0012BD6CA8|nr:hypothetical protein [Fulvivirga lutimaris]MTI38879.1 hypothetical protein [Fulvivirga lutimaris]